MAIAAQCLGFNYAAVMADFFERLGTGNASTKPLPQPKKEVTLNVTSFLFDSWSRPHGQPD
ncbi:hypothetical protein PRUB_a3296 [Pseudoalteromonas rubra]|uniref:Uncharacterized protein n=1 Tax=Pseudoalteromonas rubra TaxID=43658 RepID=A0A8T0C4J5_9GAMM|nr:hypothetical protein PRUB_a3296 [Pseudoalteromonas rubra]